MPIWLFSVVGRQIIKVVRMKTIRTIISHIKYFFFTCPLLSAWVLSCTLFFPSLYLGLFADDYFLLSVFNAERFSENSSSFLRMILHAFSFFSGEESKLIALKESALVPWWVDERLKINFFRPVSAITHWIDFYWFKEK